MKNLRVTVDGKSFNVTVEMLDEQVAVAQAKPSAPIAASAPVAPAPVAATASAAAPKAPAGPGDVPSPLSGKIVSIDVALGQTVAEGDKVATIEAMKMNTYVFSPKAGKVTAIVAQPGTAVEEGATVLVLG